MAEIDHDEIMEFFAELRRNTEMQWEETDDNAVQAGGTDDAENTGESEPVAENTGENEKHASVKAGSKTEEDKKAEIQTEKTEKLKMEIFDWIQCFVTALVCGVLIFVFVGRTIGVEGSSMMDTLHDTDRVVMVNLFYTPNKGDVVVFRSANEERFRDVPLVKRVIATAGDTIDIDFSTGEVFVNGDVIFEPYIYTVTTASEGFNGPVTIPDGFVFVMGDNRNHSVDSRSSDVGLVDTRYILGRVVFLLIPGMDGGISRDWSRFGVVS